MDCQGANSYSAILTTHQIIYLVDIARMENGRIDTSVGKLGVNPLISAYTIGFLNYVGELFILLCRRRVVFTICVEDCCFI